MLLVSFKWLLYLFAERLNRDVLFRQSYRGDMQLPERSGSLTTMEALSEYGSRRPFLALMVVLSKTNLAGNGVRSSAHVQAKASFSRGSPTRCWDPSP